MPGRGASPWSAARAWCVLTGALAAALGTAPAAGGLLDGAAPILALLLIAALAAASGLALTATMRLPTGVPVWLVASVLGYSAVSLVHLVATAGLNLAAGGATAVGAAVVVALTAWTWRRWPALETPTARRSAALQLGILLACAGITLLWTRETVTAVPAAVRTGTFPAWQDYFLHASEIAYLRDYPSFGRRSQYLTAVAQPLYHRGSYAVPAMLSAFGGVPALGAATAFWLPTGFLLCLVGIVAWGSAMGGTLAGVAAGAAVFLVPDASQYGLHNRFLSTHWLLQMAGGSGYALALVVCGLAVVTTGGRSRPRAAVATCGLLALAAAGFRVHVSLLACAMVACLAVLALRPRLTLRTVAGLAAAAAIGAGVLFWMETVELAPHLLSAAPQPWPFFLSVHSQASLQPTSFTGWAQGRGELLTFAIGYPMMLAAGCGLWLVLLVAAWLSGRLSALGWRAGTIPVALLIAHLAIIRLVPPPAHGDPTDFGHRPFPLVYIVFAVLAASALVAVARERSVRRLGHDGPVRAIVAVAVLAGLAVPYRDGASIQQRWVSEYARIPIDGEIWTAGAFIRAHANTGDVVLAAGEDPLAVLVALSERPAYLSRRALYESLGPAFAAPAARRAGVHDRLGSPDDIAALRRFGRAEGIAWYVADTPETRQWPEAVRRACAWCGERVRVFDLR